MLEASVVIATRDRAALLRGCLASLGCQSARGRFEVIVADNGSRDETAAVVAQAGGDVRCVYVAEPNRAKARNAAIAAAHGPIVIFCDDDTLAPQHFIEAHLAAHRGGDPSVVTGPIVNVTDAANPPKPGPQHYSRAFFCTCNASVAKDEVVAAGGFDERYQLYGWEDTDLGVRLRARGLPRAFAWDAYIYHLKPANAMTLQQTLARAREKGEMAARFVRKAPSWPVRLATGAHAANFLRAAIVHAGPLRRFYERVGDRKFAREMLADAAYVDALRAALRHER